VAERADHGLERARDGVLDQRSGERDRPGDGRSRPRGHRERLRDSGRARHRRADARAGRRPVRARAPARRGGARARGVAERRADLLGSNLPESRRRCMAQVETPNRATSDPNARKEVLKRIDDEGVEFVLLWFTDIEGHLKSFAVTPSEIADALDDGMGFDGSSIPGFNAIEESDMVAIPDPTTYQLMPWREGETKVGRQICDIVTTDSHPYADTPRYVQRLQ